MKDIKSFAFTSRGYDACSWPVKKYLNHYPQCLEQLNEMEQKMARAKIEQDMNWQEIVSLTGLSGRAEVIKRLRQVIAKMIDLSAV